jgi:hypothetical protein
MDSVAIRDRTEIALYVGDSDLRTRKVLKDSDPSAHLRGHLAHILKNREVFLVAPVREIESKDVCSGLDKASDLFWPAGGWSKCRDDLRATLL